MRLGTTAARSHRATTWILLLQAGVAPPYRGPILSAAVGLTAAAAVDLHADLPLLCGNPADYPSPDRISASLQFLLALNPPTTLAFAWLAMLVTMMTPLIAVPLAHVCASSLAGRRWRAATVFLLGYFGVWVLAGLPLMVMAFLARIIIGDPWAAFAHASLLAVAWSANPLQQAARNRAHRLRRIGLFGLAADRDCLVFGTTLGGWCLVSCWTWMLVPMFAPSGHILAMIAVSAILMAERLRGPGPLRWRVPVPLSIVAWGWSSLRAFSVWHRARA